VDFAEERARLERLAGRPVAAREALENLRPENLSSEEDGRRLERFARSLWAGGDMEPAWKAFTRLFDTLERDGPLVWSPSWEDARVWIEWTRVVHGPAEAFRRTQRRISRLRMKGGDGYPARVRRWCADWLENHRERGLLDAARERGPAQGRKELHAALKAAGPKVFDSPEYALPRSGFEDLVYAYFGQWNDGDLWKHLHEAGRLDELDRKLGEALGSGSHGAQASKATRLAKLRRERNQPKRELAALRAAPHAQGPTWHLSDAARRRMLDLVVDLEGEEALVEALSGRSLWGLNEALRRERPALAARLLDENFGPGPGSGAKHTRTTLRWQRTGHTRIAAAFDLPPAGVEAAYDGLLDRRPVGPRLAGGPDPDEAAVGTDYFQHAVRYSRWLLARGRKDEALGYASALVEGAPRDAFAEVETARLLHDLGQPEEARRRLDSALARKPGDWRMQERCLVALHAWGEKEEGLRRLKAWSGPESLRDGKWRDLLRIGDSLAETATVVGWLREALLVADPQIPVEWLEEVVGACEERLDPEGRASFRKALLAAWKGDGPRSEVLARRPGAPAAFRLEAFGHVLAAFAKAPPRVRLDYQRRMAAAATHAKDAARSRAALAAIQDLEGELKDAGESVPELRLERAELRFALGDGAEAEALVKDYLGPSQEVGAAKARYVAAHRVLTEAGRSAEAAALRRRYYQERERLGGGRSREVLAGLVREALAAGEAEQARALATRLARLDPSDGGTLGWLGRTLIEAGQAEQATGYLERALRVRPHDLSLRLALGEAQMALPDGLEAGLGSLAALVRDRRCGLELRRKAMATLRRIAPSQADLDRAWKPALVDAEAERLWGEAAAAAGRGDFVDAIHRFRRAGEVDPVAVDPWKELVRLLQGANGGEPEAVAAALDQLQRRESAQGGRKRFTRHRLFWARGSGTAGGGAGSLHLLQLDPSFERLRERLLEDPEDAAWARILGATQEHETREYYPEFHGDVHDEGGGSLGLPGWGGDAGVEADPFQLDPPPDPPEVVVARLAEGLPAHEFLMMVAQAHRGAGELIRAGHVLEVAEALATDVPQRTAVEAAQEMVRKGLEVQAERRDRRLVLASE
jgi:tetratricopeptide (TPR) repeat protein